MDIDRALGLQRVDDRASVIAEQVRLDRSQIDRERRDFLLTLSIALEQSRCVRSAAALALTLPKWLELTAGAADAG